MQQQILRSLFLTVVAAALALAPNAHAQSNGRAANRPSSTGIPSAAPRGAATGHVTPLFTDNIAGAVKARKIITGFPQDQGYGNCFPFGCAYDGEYQQVYTSSLFSKAINIVGLQFANTQVNDSAITTNGGTFTISLSTTAADWNSLAPDFNSNLGSNNTQVFSGSLYQPWAFGYSLNIPFSTPFQYDPSAGNLLVDVRVSGSSDANGIIYFDSNGYNDGGYNGNTIFGRVYCYNGTNCVPGNIVADPGYGLATAFIVRPK